MHGGSPLPLFVMLLRERHRPGPRRDGKRSYCCSAAPASPLYCMAARKPACHSSSVACCAWCAASVHCCTTLRLPLVGRAVVLAASLPVSEALALPAACAWRALASATFFGVSLLVCAALAPPPAAWRALASATFFGVSLLVSDIDLGPHVRLSAIITYMHYTYGRAVGQDSVPRYGPLDTVGASAPAMQPEDTAHVRGVTTPRPGLRPRRSFPR